MRVLNTLLATLLLALAASQPAQAGRICQEFKPDPLTVQKALQLALATRNALESSARLFAANVHFDDHSMDERLSGRYQAVTDEPVVGFVEQTNAQASRHVVRLP